MEKQINPPEKIIDIHCHLFNLKYLPVAGIVRRYSNNKVPHIIAKGLEWLLHKNTGESFSAHLEHFIYSDKPGYYNMPLHEYLGEEKLDYEMYEIFDFQPAESVTAIENMSLVGDVLEGELSNALDEYEKLNEPGLEGFVNFELMDETSRIKHRAGLLRRMLNWILEKAEALKNYIKWFIFMTNSEEDIYNHIVNKDELGVDKYLHLMMDVDHFFNKNSGDLRYRSYFDFEKVQIPNFQRLNSTHSNLIGFVAFNPARKNCLEIIDDALKNKGFRGVKVYPPLGYKPYDDDLYSKNIKELFVYCEKARVPLFTHCNNQGFEAWPKKKSGYCSNPVNWELVLEEHPDLILCLAHGGGVEGWFSPNLASDKLKASEIQAGDIKDEKEAQKDWNKSYASMVFKLCVKYPNVYCDAAYLDEMVNSDGSFNIEAKGHFKKRLLKLFKSESRFAKKIMYGSDWHMLFQEGKNNVYLKNYIEFFSDTEFDNYRNDFFYNNANSYLNAK